MRWINCKYAGENESGHQSEGWVHEILINNSLVSSLIVIVLIYKGSRDKQSCFAR
jgi:hypothetical protein